LESLRKFIGKSLKACVNLILKYNVGSTLITIIDLSAILCAVATLFLTIFAVIQLRHMEKHRNVEVSMKLFEWGENDRLRMAFKRVENKFQFKDHNEYKGQEKVNEEVGDYPYVVTGSLSKHAIWLRKSL
jgi:hypothetical protein